MLALLLAILADFTQVAFAAVRLWGYIKKHLKLTINMNQVAARLTKKLSELGKDPGPVPFKKNPLTKAMLD